MLKNNVSLIYKIFVSTVFFGIILFLSTKEGYAIGRSLMVAFTLFTTTFFILILRRLFFGFLLGSILSLCVYFASNIKYQNMGITLNLADFRFYAQSPAESFQILLNYINFLSLIKILLIPIFLILFIKLEKKFQFKRTRYFLIWFTLLTTYFLFSRSVLKSYAVYLYGSEKKLSDITLTQAPSVSAFAASVFVDGIQIPNFKNENHIFSLSGNTNIKPVSGQKKQPNIFVWLEESTFDPKMLSGCSKKICESPVFSKNNEREFFNLLRVHTWGGGTWTSEFAFLSGLDHQVFGPLGMNAPITLAPYLNHSLPNYLKSLGYETIAFYPVNKAYLNAGPAYRFYGFDQVLDVIDEGEGNNWNSSDEKLFKLFQKVLGKQNTEKPMFVFMLTIYQHGPHTESSDKPRIVQYDYPKFSFANPDLQNKLENYLYRLKDSEKVILDAEKYIADKNIGKNWIFAHFGDHQPSFGEELANRKIYDRTKFKNVEPHRITYFKLKANYKLPALENFDDIDLSFLGNYILNAAELPLDSFYRANQILLEKCFGKYSSCGDRQLWESYNNFIFNELRVIEH